MLAYAEINYPQYTDITVSFVDYGFLSVVGVAIYLVGGGSVVLSCSCCLWNRDSEKFCAK